MFLLHVRVGVTSHCKTFIIINTGDLIIYLSFSHFLGKTFSHQPTPYFNREFPTLGGPDNGEAKPDGKENYGPAPVIRNTRKEIVSYISPYLSLISAKPLIASFD